MSYFFIHNRHSHYKDVKIVRVRGSIVAAMEGAKRYHGVIVLLVVATAAASVRGAKFNVPIFMEFNNYRESQANVTLLCMNEITGGRTPEHSIMPFSRLTFTVTPDAYYNVYAEMTCYFYNTTTDGNYLVAIDPWAGMGPNVDSAVLTYEWNIWDACFDLNRHYVNGTKLTPCLYFWPGHP